MATHFQATIVLAHVVPSVPPIPADPAYVFEGPEYERLQQAEAEKHLAIVAKAIPPRLKARTIIGSGDAAEEIVRLATTEVADLIVIATHGLTGWRHLVFGSVAEKVIRMSDRPVLVIPVHKPEEK